MSTDPLRKRSVVVSFREIEKINFYRIFGREAIFEDWGDLVEDRGDLSGQPRLSQPEVDFADSGEPEAGPEKYFQGK